MTNLKDKSKKQKMEESISKVSLGYLSYLFKANGELVYIEQHLRLLLGTNCHENIFINNMDRIKKLANILQNNLSDRKYLISIDNNICQMAYGIEYLFYLKQLEDYLEAIINFEWDNPMLDHDNDKYNKILDWLIEIIKFRAEAHLLGSKLSEIYLRDKMQANNIINNLKDYLKDYNNSNNFNFLHRLKLNDDLNIDMKPEMVRKICYSSPPKRKIQKLGNVVDEIGSRAKSEYQIEIS